MKNNLFYYATKELSQDAFICWLMSYAMKDAKKDDALRSCAIDFIKEFVPNLKDNKPDSIYVSDIKHQDNRIDATITVNSKHIIIIEDKTYTKEHGEQLNTYVEKINKTKGDKTLNLVYYKTGFQGDYSKVIGAKYQICDREKIDNILKPYASKTSNQIFLDYYEFIDEFNKASKAYDAIPVAQWNTRQINGFYKYLLDSMFFERKGFKSNYGYVPNQGGGFYAMWIFNETFKTYPGTNQDYELYLQLEYVKKSLKICYKISIDTVKGTPYEVELKQIRDFSTCGNDKKNNEKYALEKYGFIKPERFGSGKTMTLGVYSAAITTFNDAIEALENAIKSFVVITKI